MLGRRRKTMHQHIKDMKINVETDEGTLLSTETRAVVVLSIDKATNQGVALLNGSTSEIAAMLTGMFMEYPHLREAVTLGLDVHSHREEN